MVKGTAPPTYFNFQDSKGKAWSATAQSPGLEFQRPGSCPGSAHDQYVHLGQAM